MTKPDDVPEDVWKSALESRKQWANGPGDITLACARAIMAERERCAKIAQDDDGEHTIWGEDRNTRVAQKTAKALAAAIRGATA